MADLIARLNADDYITPEFLAALDTDFDLPL
jgi:hypothetical protein